jgi:Mg-chelatase subunit ChlD
VPRLIVEENAKYPDEVAVMVSFVPTFEPVQPQEQVCEDQEPESTVILNPEDFFYIFIVDRSGSMNGDRIVVTKEAMKLFIKSLPPQSKF